MTRKRLPERRYVVTCRVPHTYHSGNQVHLTVSYGIREDDGIREVFCSSFKTGDDMMTLMVDASILVSRCLQHGDTLENIAQALCEPRSLIGSIVEHGTGVQEEIG